MLGAGSAFGQYNTAEISGTVRDEQGGLLSAVSVVATHSALGFRLERITDGGGRFFLPALPVGEYSLTVELDGYRYHGTRHAWERDRQREREARSRGDEFRRYTWFDVVEDPEPMLRDLQALLTRQLQFAG